ncbi:MAG: hypothetical protein MHM6MM_007581 [Cercozoa sp. M6MM]
MTWHATQYGTSLCVLFWPTLGTLNQRVATALGAAPSNEKRQVLALLLLCMSIVSPLTHLLSLYWEFHLHQIALCAYIVFLTLVVLSLSVFQLPVSSRVQYHIRATVLLSVVLLYVLPVASILLPCAALSYILWREHRVHLLESRMMESGDTDFEQALKELDDELAVQTETDAFLDDSDHE